MRLTQLAGKYVWFLTGSQSLYGAQTLQQVATQTAAVVAQLNQAPAIPVPIKVQPVLTTGQDIRAVMLAANADDSCIGVICWMHTFSPAKMWIGGLQALAKPMIHLHTQANVELPWEDIDMDFMNLNQAAHGDREFAYLATRLGAARKTVVGHASHPAVQAEVATWMRACLGLLAARTMRIARFGDNMRYVAVTEGDKTEAEVRLGVQVNTWPVNELASMVAAAPANEIDALITQYEDSYDIAAPLRRGGTRHESLRYAAAIEVGLRTFLTQGGFTAFTDSFEDLGSLQQLPGLAVQRLMADGYGFGAEGDWKTAALVRIAAAMGEGLAGGASLMEDYTYDLVPGDEKILGAHMLEVSPSLTNAKPRVEIHPLAIGGRQDPVRLVFTAAAGPAVVVAMSDMRDRFRLVANVVDLVTPPSQLPRLPVGRAVWKPRPSFATSAACWLAAGAAHHTVMTTAIGVEEFIDFAQMAQLELLVIDEETTRRSFAKELAWNQAYYRLRDGL